MKRPRGTYWLLESGRARQRRTVSLRYVTEDQANTALTRLQAEEDAGTSARVFALHAEDPESAIRYLLGDDAIARLLPEGPVDYASMTVETYFDEVFWPVRSDPESRIGIRPSTSAVERVYWRHKGGRDGRGPRNGILDGEIGGTRLRDLDDPLWERWQASQAQLSGRAKALRRNAYSAMLSYARRMGHIQYRPEFFPIKGSTKTTREKSDPLSLEEVLALLDAAIPMRRAMWAVGVGQGLRPGELVRVHWEDVDWDTQVLQVRGTKTEASAEAIPMTPLAFRELRTWWVRLGQPTEGWCFRFRGQPIRQYKRSLATDAAAAGIARKVTPNLLRHSFATLAWSLGMEMDVARRILRHTDERMLRQVYCRPRPAELVAKAAAFDL